MATRRVGFAGHDGSRRAGRLELPPGPVRAYALFAACFTCGKDVLAAVRIAQALAQRDIAVLRFDVAGVGESEGAFFAGGFAGQVDDLVAAADWLRSEHQAPALLVGHSLGGATAIAAADRIPEVRAVVAIAAPAEPVHVCHLFGTAVAKARAKGEAEAVVGGKRFRITRDLLEDLEGARFEQELSGLVQPLLLMHSPVDTVVSVEHARRIYAMARHPKSFVSLDDADHLLTRRADAEYAAQVLAAWAERFLPPREPLPHGGDVEVSSSDAGPFITLVRAGRHMLLADEPTTVGGEDAGPDPYELLLASLGACTAMTLRMYARHKQLPLEQVSVQLSHRRVHAEDCEDCEGQPRKLELIERVVRLEGPLDAAQRRRLLEIADRCPVHRTLSGELRIATREAGPEDAT